MSIRLNSCKKYPTNNLYWKYYLQITKQRFSSFNLSNIRNQFKYCYEVIEKERLSLLMKVKFICNNIILTYNMVELYIFYEG